MNATIITCKIKEVVGTNANQKYSLGNKTCCFYWPQYLSYISTDRFKLFHLFCKENYFSLQKYNILNYFNCSINSENT